MSLPHRARVLVVDDHPTFRIGLAKLLESLGASVHGVASVGEGIDALDRGLAFDLVLYDWHLPQGGGLRGLLALRHLAPSTLFAIVTGDEEEAIRWAAERGGVAVLIQKSCDPAVLLTLLAGMLRQGTEVPAPEADRRTDLRPDPMLSARQLAVLARLSLGEPDKDIARALKISHHTVRGHVSDILAVLGARNRTHAVLLAAGLGLIDPVTPRH